MVSVKPSWKTTRSMPGLGEFCGVPHPKGLIIGLTAEPPRQGRPPALLVLHAPAGTGLVGKYVPQLQSSRGFLRLEDVELRFSVGDLQHGDPDHVPTGTLILGEDEHSFFVRTDDPNEFAVSLKTGEIGPADLYRSFWTPRWKLVHAGADEAAEPIFEFGEAPAG